MINSMSGPGYAASLLMGQSDALCSCQNLSWLAFSEDVGNELMVWVSIVQFFLLTQICGFSIIQILVNMLNLNILS